MKLKNEIVTETQNNSLRMQHNHTHTRPRSGLRPVRSINRDAASEDSDFFARWGLSRYKVILQVIPWTLLCLGIRLALALSPIQFTGVFATETVTPFTTSSMFVIAIILAGVLDDYKEAEKIPADLVCTIDALSERISFVSLVTAREKAKHDAKHHKQASLVASQGTAAATPQPTTLLLQGGKQEEEEEIIVLDTDAAHYELLCLLECILEFLAGLRNEQDMLGIVSVYCKWFSLKIYECQEVSSIEVWEIGDLFDSMRETLMRLSVIKRTNFIPSGQTLMKCLVFITVMLVTLAKYENGNGPDVPAGGGGRRLWRTGDDPANDAIVNSDDYFAEHIAPYFNVGTYCFLFIYVLYLIEDIEDPFEYSSLSLLPEPSTNNEDGRLVAFSSGSADIDSYPLLELYCRLAALGGRSDITGGAPHSCIAGLRPEYTLIGPDGLLGEVRTPTEAVEHSEKAHDTRQQIASRCKYRQLLQDATYTVLNSIRNQYLENKGDPNQQYVELGNRVGGGVGGLSLNAPLITNQQ
jgi:hypothetical protein